MAHTGGSTAVVQIRAAADISYSRLLRYRAEYDVAREEAARAVEELQRLLSNGAGIRAVAEASCQAKFATARLCTASACLISPP
jgi:hypothetical protein